ncbi:MAG: DUF3108 domain-containing protein [Betaproteobacteria bacterium]|nr:DUF3108 domain-containing protein [Betaproteobacteria bacterium]MDH5219652.1 DUF3108 domain-containing protein [Betaproteobacteria bacterium]MDH5349635.1 DUF3108 domain-containing protein [Betaproteobacteria bacterium]
MRRWCTAIASSLLVVACDVHAAPPERVVIDYEVRYNGSAMATAKHVLEHDGKTYRLVETWEGSGLLSLLGEVRRTSEGMVTPDGLRPLVYEDRRPRRDLATARFSWKERTLIQQFRGAPRTEPIPPNAQDRLSLVFAPAFKVPGKGPLDFHVADGKGVAHYVFEIAGRERLRVPAGEFDALHLVKRDNDGRATEWWLDAGHAYLPLRVLVVRKDGTRIDQLAARITPAP